MINKHTIEPISTLPPQYIDITGNRYSRLVVVSLYGYRQYPQTLVWYWNCLCDCGNTTIVAGTSLRAGTTMSCGCIRRQRVGAATIKHSMSKTREYAAYTSAKQRCNNPNYRAFQHYGGRGIKFCFDSFEDFFAEVGRKPSPQHSLDRINYNGHYEKGNLRWATPSEQHSNTRHAHLITHNNITQSLTQWARECGISSRALYARLNKLKWCVECSLTLPIHSGLKGCTHRFL